MKNDKDLLSVDNSPQTLEKTGVKRVNNLPLFIAIGVLTIFIALIAFVAAKRANAEQQALPVAKIKSAHKNSLSLADEIIKNRPRGSVKVFETDKPMAEEIPPAMPLPVSPPTKEEMLVDELPEAELERIRQVKAQAFEEAVNAKTSISFDSRQNRSNNATGAYNQSSNMPQLNVAQEFKEQLQLLQGFQKKQKPMPQTLGGEESSMRWHLNSRLESPQTPYVLKTGSVIPGVMVSGIRSELPGQIIGQVSQNVYDSATGKHLLIPQGTKLFGIYSSDVSFGQDSILVAWQRLDFPDAKSLDIGSMPGTDSAGYAGFRDQMDHHYLRIYGSALLMSGIVGGISYSQNINQPNQLGYSQPTAGSVLSEALGQQLGEVTSQLISKNLNVPPTGKIRHGYRFNIIVVKDLVFKQPYKQFAY